MRILLLTVDFPPQKGGIQNLLAHLAEGLGLSNEVAVVAPRAAATSELDGQRSFAVARAPRFRVAPLSMVSFGIAGLLRALRRPPDVVLCGHVLLGPACWLLARAFGVPLVVFAYAWEIRAPRMRRLAGWTLRHATSVISISAFTRESVIAHGVPGQRVTLMHPAGAEYPDVHRHVETPAEPHEKIILTVARLGEIYKGHDMVIRSMPLILAREPNARCVIVGDGPLRGYLERLASALGVRRAVTFAGEISDELLDAWYRRADVFALISRESPIDGGAEGFGLAFVEAGARGKPVVGGRSGGIPDAVLDGVTGLLVEPSEISAIAAAIHRVLSDPELAARLGSQGRHRALNDLTWPKAVASVQAVLDAAVATPRLEQRVRSVRS